MVYRYDSDNTVARGCRLQAAGTGTSENDGIDDNGDEIVVSSYCVWMNVALSTVLICFC
jgi:hypothetical protein